MFEPKYKDKYTVNWCDQCSVFSITCPDCGCSSCSGGGCGKCSDNFEEFLETPGINHYLTDEEILVYYKIQSLKRIIVQQMEMGNFQELDFVKLNKEGFLSKKDKELFHDKIN